MEPDLRVGAAAVGKFSAILGIFTLLTLRVSPAQTLPQDELQVNMNGYTDNFRVNVIYPTISLTKSLGSATSLNARYLIDAISSASMKSHFEVDGISSATRLEHGGGGLIDEVRHQFGAGVTQLVSDATVSINGIYGAEADYTSTTLATQLSVPFAKNNTIVQAGFVRSRDRVSPENRTWNRSLDVTTWSGGLTQVLGRRFILQLDASYTQNRGFQSDSYMVVSIIGSDKISTFEPAHPDARDRKAIGLRANYKLDARNALKLGYRYYSDDWDVRSHTATAHLDHRYDSGVVVGTGLRLYSQSDAFFFQSGYDSFQEFMTVDSKLDIGYSAEFEIEAIWTGPSLMRIPVLGAIFNDRVDLTTRFDFYVRHTDSPNWHSRFRTLYAYILSLGYRYRF